VVAVNAADAARSTDRVNRPETCAAAISGEMEPKTRPRPAEGGVTQPVAGRGGVEKVGGKGIWVAAPAWNDRGAGLGRTGSRSLILDVQPKNRSYLSNIERALGLKSEPLRMIS
jgi:hypothetical protein